MIQGITSGGHVGVLAITALRYAQSDGQEVILPVRRAQMVYANFKHIQVRPESRREDGIPLYKLKILDMLIDQLSSKDAGHAPWTIGATAGAKASARTGALSGMNADSVDALITGMSIVLRSSGPSGSSYRAVFLPEPGAFVDLVA